MQVKVTGEKNGNFGCIATHENERISHILPFEIENVGQGHGGYKRDLRCSIAYV